MEASAATAAGAGAAGTGADYPAERHKRRNRLASAKLAAPACQFAPATANREPAAGGIHDAAQAALPPCPASGSPSRCVPSSRQASAAALGCQCKAQYAAEKPALGRQICRQNSALSASWDVRNRSARMQLRVSKGPRSTAYGAGGTASGGTTNTTGNSGSGQTGGTALNGGTDYGGNGGATYSGCGASGGGGSGGYSTQTYSAGQLTVGASITVVVGDVGAAGINTYYGGSYSGLAGGGGQVYISWN